MPRGDQTGPDGGGPMTGRAVGYCAGYAAPGYVQSLLGRGGRGAGRGCGFGAGRGWRNRYYATGLTGRQRILAEESPNDERPSTIAPASAAARTSERQALLQQMSRLESALADVRRRVKELEGDDHAN